MVPYWVPNHPLKSFFKKQPLSYLPQICLHSVVSLESLFYFDYTSM